jgi:hypothetical protein
VVSSSSHPFAASWNASLTSTPARGARRGPRSCRPPPTILGFNRLRGAAAENAVPIAASIVLDVFNVFLFVLQLFSGKREWTSIATVTSST